MKCLITIIIAASSPVGPQWDFSRIKAGGLRMTMETDKKVGAKVIELSDQNIPRDDLGLQSGEPLS
jgi:hypothetical protein